MSDVDWQGATITDDGIDAIRAELGHRKPVPNWNRLVTAEGIEHFAWGLGDDNPLWWDKSWAEASRWGRRIAPPCYLYSHTRGPRLKAEDGQQGVSRYLPGVLGVWAGERWRFHRPAAEGETIRAEGELVDVTVRDGQFGGRTVSHTERQYLISDQGDVVAEVDHRIVRVERGQARDRKVYRERPLATYDADARLEIEQHYERELEQRRGGTPRFVEDVMPGDIVGPMLKGPLTVTNLVGFLLGSGSGLNATHRMLHSYLKLHPGAKMVHPESGEIDTIEAAHWEQGFANASGMPAPYDFGFQRVSWISHLLTDWAGDDGFLKELDVSLRRPNVLGDITWIRGAVTAVDPALGRATVEVSATNQLDEVTAQATAVVELPSREAK